MKVSLNWLSDHLDLTGRSTQELADMLTFSGIEVEGIESKGVRSEHIVIAQVKSYEPHPNADRLRLCQVDDGSGQPRQIVCGAKNFEVGDKVPLALPGAVLPGNFEIKENKLRGVLSQGMMCSGRELGLSEDHEGLLILSAEAPIGRPFHEIVETDTIFELEITPNRPDCLSHLGVARELAALAKLPLKGPTAHNDIKATIKNASADEVRIEDLSGCPFYTARRIRGVKVGPSPEWLQKRLQSVGLRPINNVVDITNYVLLEMGQPLHAFDLAKLKGGIIVRNAQGGESFLALDGQKYSLTTADLVIADHQSPVAIAGVMGGEHSGVTEATTDLLLESAYFTPQRIRRTSRSLGLISDSSYRFERGVDPQQVIGASDLASRLIAEICGGTVEPAFLGAGSPPKLVGDLTLDVPRCQALLGKDIPEREMAEILQRLGLAKSAGTTFRVPSYRLDLHRSVDLVEEIARVYDIANIPASHLAIPSEESAADLAYDFGQKLRATLVGRGFYEAQTIKLISHSELATVLGTNPGPQEAVPLKNPLSDDHTHLRPSLIPGLLATAARNFRQGASSVRFFEFGTVFAKSKKPEPDEKTNLGLILGGPVAESSWHEAAPRLNDVFDLRGVLELLCSGTSIKLKPMKHAWLLVAAQILVNGKPVGLCGQVRPSQVREMDGRTPLFVAELNVALLQTTLQRPVRFAELPRYPSITRDVALGVALDVAHGQFEDFFSGQRTKEPLLEAVDIFDVFHDPTGQKLPKDQKSVAYRLTYRTKERTLESAEVDSVHNRVLEALKKALPVQVR